MADVVRNIAIQLIGERCFATYAFEMDFFNADCFKVLLSKILGYGIVAGSVTVKLPQILKIYNSKSAKGLSMFALTLELLAITFNLAYSFVKGFPFSSYGDSTFLAIQTAIIAALSLLYQGSHRNMILFSIFYTIFCYVLLSGLTPLDVLWMLQACVIPIMLTGKATQAMTNYKNQSTGQLSAITCFVMSLGAVARVFTSIQETGDIMVVLTYIASSLANGLISGQVLWYWNADKKKVE